MEMRIEGKDHRGGLFLEKVICWVYFSFIQEDSQLWTMAGIGRKSQLLGVWGGIRKKKKIFPFLKSIKKECYQVKVRRDSGEGMRKF